MSKRKTNPVTATNDHNKIIKHTHHEVANTDMPFQHEVLFEIFKFIPVSDLLTDSLVCKQWNTVAHNNQLWKSVFEKQYQDHPFAPKDPLFGGNLIEKLAESTFSNCLYKAMYALKKSFHKLQVISKQNIHADMAELFEGDYDEGFTFKDGEENFEPTLEMKQMITGWTPYEDGIKGNKYGHFICDECAENEDLCKVIFKNPLSEQVFVFYEVSNSNPYGSIHLENEEAYFALHSEGCLQTRNDSPMELPNFDFMIALQRFINDLQECPEHLLYYAEKTFEPKNYLGPKKGNIY
ncbi:hypothetical protein C9374_004549 [Naegleria lovaniensis]|uniref:F-box domain-containing protein n=1 Tax=Naegleria lovaniensis TaxID=51637 RepID=A0AA88GRX0_NAELO|nr:uncharacterized protein C9374_004549 [Naegleria lovaniensis]KAG2383212.1 hypothetical protein C9374_004549 [Naegleria lovaniensis]